MNITLFIGSMYGGGAERVTCNLASWLAEHGHTVEILTMSETEKTYELSPKVTTATLLGLSERAGSAKNILLRLTRLASYLVKHREKDAYIVMLPKTTRLLMAMRGLTKAKIITSERGDPSQSAPKVQKIIRRNAPKFDGFVFQTEDARSWYGKTVECVPNRVIPNAINPAFLRPAYSGERRKEIAAAGRLTSCKRFELLLQAFADIAPDFPDYSLTVYGEGRLREQLTEMARELGVEERFCLPGNVTDIADRLSPASLFVLPSDYEGMPNALMEAMALGLPCISTDCPVGGPRFLIQQGSNGVLVPVGDRKALADAIRLVLSDAELAAKMGANASEIQKRLAPDIIYSQWEAFIRSCITE